MQDRGVPCSPRLSIRRSCDYVVACRGGACRVVEPGPPWDGALDGPFDSPATVSQQTIDTLRYSRHSVTEIPRTISAGSSSLKRHKPLPRTLHDTIEGSRPEAPTGTMRLMFVKEMDRL